jgi:hypothetical protein
MSAIKEKAHSLIKEKLHSKSECKKRGESFLNTCSYWFLKVFLFLIPPYPIKK